MFAGWIPKFALALAVLLALGWGALRQPPVAGSKAAVQPWSIAAPRRSAPPRAPVNAHAASAPAEAAGQAERVRVPRRLPHPASSSPMLDQGPQSVAPESTISVTPRRTLLGICVESFGKCNPGLLQEIRKLNPGLSNPDHIESGQKIRLPVGSQYEAAG